MQDADLAVVMACNTRLLTLALAACGDLTDGALAALPASLHHLQLTCCEGVEGKPLYRLRALRTLRLSGCPAVTAAAVQRAVAACRQLRLVELPITLPTDCLPVSGGAALRRIGVVGTGRR